jgi:hypothetical protein
LALLLRWGCEHVLRSVREQLPDRQLHTPIQDLLAVNPIDLDRLESGASIRCR